MIRRLILSYMIQSAKFWENRNRENAGLNYRKTGRIMLQY